MDDYILEILRMQGTPKESPEQKLKLETEELSAGGNAAAQYRAESALENTAQDAVPAAKEADEVRLEQSVRQQNTGRSSENVRRMLQKMEPVRSTSAAESLRESVQTEASTSLGAKTGEAIFSGTSRGAGETGISPESLSMFFQRDARRYP